MQTQESFISVRQGGAVAYVGPDATNLLRAKVLIAGLRLYAKCGMMPTRGVTGPVMLKMASEYSGKKYKRGQYETAIADVQKWADTMQAALPVVEAQK